MEMDRVERRMVDKKVDMMMMIVHRLVSGICAFCWYGRKRLLVFGGWVFKPKKFFIHDQACH